MNRFTILERHGAIAVLTLNRTEVLNAWHAPMRQEVIDALVAFDADETVGAIVLTGAGRAFSAGQDLNEALAFDSDRAAEWIDEWRTMYGTVRGLRKPFVAALNGDAAGSGFQVALLADIRVGHSGVRMGQTEIDDGIPSTLGPWIMREVLGLSRTIELTVTGRMMEARECMDLGLIHHLVEPEAVVPTALTVAGNLASKPPVAMRLNKQRFREMTEAGFEDALQAGGRIQREAFRSGEPQEMMRRFLAERALRKA